MRRFTRLVLVLYSVALCSSFQRQQERQPPPIRVEVEAVNVLATVTDRRGRYVTNLKQDRFEVYEDGVLQEVTHFDQPADLPLLLAVLIDTSASVRLHLDFQKEAATDFLHAVLRPEDRALVAEFDTGVSLLRDFTNRPSLLSQAIFNLKAGGGTALYDALYLICRDKFWGLEGRKGFVILSDGVDLNSRHTLEEAVRGLLTQGITVYAIGTQRLQASGDRDGQRLLERLADETGGRAFFPYSNELLTAAFEVINTELRSQYSLTYVPANLERDGKFRKLEVKLKRGRGLNIHHRKGYYTPIE